jgi:hypothetical protein
MLASMSATFLLMSPLPASALVELEAECTRAIDEYLGEHPDCEDECGEIGVGGFIPTADEVRAAHRQYRLALPAEVLTRLAECKSVLSIDHPGDPDVDKLLVSVLRFLLLRIGIGLVLLNDYPLETSDAVLMRLKKKRGAPGFDHVAAPPKPQPQAAQPRKERPGEVRSLRLSEQLSNVMYDRDLAIDFERVASRLPPLSLAYAKLLLEEGAQSDARAAKTLAVSRAELDTAVTALAEALER